MRVLSVVGARPQFIKAAAISAELRESHEEILVHTGQHFDVGMSDVFFDELGIPAPAHHLGVSGVGHGAMVGRMLEALERVIISERPDLVLVYGDTNSTLAAALAAAKLHTPVAHVEAGLRSYDRKMPEEINRVLTDHLASLLFCPSETANRNLKSEGIFAGVHVVGDVMLDSLQAAAIRARRRPGRHEALGLADGGFILATLHRAENTDDPARLAEIIAGLAALDEAVLLPIHPRTRAALDRTGILVGGRIRLLDPVGYLDMVRLEQSARAIVTDSGGVQKEAYWLGVPCITVRESTEWTETIDAGWNRLVPADRYVIAAAARSASRPTTSRPPLYGEEGAARRIVDIITEKMVCAAARS